MADPSVTPTGMGADLQAQEIDQAVLSNDQLRQLLASGVPLDVVLRMSRSRGMPDSGWSPTGYGRQWQYPYAGSQLDAQSQSGPQRDSGMMGMMQQRNALQGLQNTAAYTDAGPQAPNNYLAQLMQMLTGMMR